MVPAPEPGKKQEFSQAKWEQGIAGGENKKKGQHRETCIDYQEEGKTQSVRLKRGKNPQHARRRDRRIGMQRALILGKKKKGNLNHHAPNDWGEKKGGG